MNFTVEWLDEALQQLAAIWVDADDPAAVTAASHRLEQSIRADPLGAGESRDGDDRVVFDPPLALLYRVYPQQRSALVVSVGWSRRPGP